MDYRNLFRHLADTFRQGRVPGRARPPAKEPPSRAVPPPGVTALRGAAHWTIYDLELRQRMAEGAGPR